MQKSDIKNFIDDMPDGMWWYQDIDFKGLRVPLRYPKQRYSKFYQLGKWDNFILPLIPFDDFDTRDFVELGCNAGLYLLEAAKLGFKRVIGYEADHNFFVQLNTAMLYFREQNPSLYMRIDWYRNVIGKPEKNVDASGVLQLEPRGIFVCDLVLIANLLYYLDETTALDLIKELAHRALYALVVTVEDAKNQSSGDLDRTISYFSVYWKLKKLRKTTGELNDGDPAPRKMASMLFESKIVREMDTDDLIQDTLKCGRKRRRDNESFYEKFGEFARLALNGRDTMSSGYLDYLLGRGKLGHIKTPDEIRKYVIWLHKLVCDLKNNGLREPITYFVGKGDRIDGFHRLAILKELGYRRVIVKNQLRDKK